MPVAVTWKLAGAGSVTATSAGCTVIAGAMVAAVTVRVAVELVALPRSLLTTTRNRIPFSPSAVATMAKLGLVAPEIGAKFLPPSLLECHW